MSQLLLKLQEVTFSYTKNHEPLLKKVNLELYAGQRIGIVGDNGSGKSTIVKLLLGLHSSGNREGKIELFSKPVSWRNHYPYLGYIGDPSHNPGELGLPTDISVGEVVNSFKELWQNSHNLSCSKLIKQLRLDELYERDVGKISTGERKKLMTFLALGKETKLLIADEATEGLDKQAKPIVIDLVKQATSNKQLGLLWISHRYDEIAMLTDEVYELSKGKLVKLNVKGFDCEIETNLMNGSQDYHNFDKNGLFNLLGEICLNSKISNFEIKGCRSSK